MAFSGLLETSRWQIFTTIIHHLMFMFPKFVQVGLYLMGGGGWWEGVYMGDGGLYLGFFFLFFNWASLHTRLNSYYEAWSYKKRSAKKITGYRKFVQKEPTVKRCQLILDLKPLRSQFKAKHPIDREFQSLAAQEKKLFIQIPL